MRFVPPALATAFFALPVSGMEVATDIPVVHSLVAQVMGGLDEPTLLLESGADAHDFQLRPSQVRALEGADLVIWIGPEMTPWLDRALTAIDGPVSLPLLENDATHRRSFDAEADEEDHAEEAYGHTHHAGTDPHAWLDPDNAGAWIGLITDALVELDPGNAVTYRANATLSLTRIETLDRTLTERLAEIHNDPIIVAHDAYGYFAEHFGISIIGSIAEGDSTEPGAAHLSKLRDQLEDEKAECIFPEAYRDAAPVETLSEGSSVKIGAPLDPEGRAMAPGPDLYPRLLTSLADAIIDCIGDS